MQFNSERVLNSIIKLCHGVASKAEGFVEMQIPESDKKKEQTVKLIKDLDDGLNKIAEDHNQHQYFQIT